jgi:hypothetical protein
MLGFGQTKNPEWLTRGFGFESRGGSARVYPCPEWGLIMIARIMIDVAKFKSIEGSITPGARICQAALA